jgi:hypothetical protein
MHGFNHLRGLPPLGVNFGYPLDDANVFDDGIPNSILSDGSQDWLING